MVSIWSENLTVKNVKILHKKQNDCHDVDHAYAFMTQHKMTTQNMLNRVCKANFMKMGWLVYLQHLKIECTEKNTRKKSNFSGRVTPKPQLISILI